jgi:hypothetical protein
VAIAEIVSSREYIFVPCVIGVSRFIKPSGNLERISQVERYFAGSIREQYDYGDTNP